MRLTPTRVSSRNVHGSLRALSLVCCLTGFGCALNTSGGSDPEETAEPEPEPDSTAEVLAAEAEEPAADTESPGTEVGPAEVAVERAAIVNRPAVGQTVASITLPEDPSSEDPVVEDPVVEDPPVEDPPVEDPEPEVPVEDTLCLLPNGDPLPYDYTRGIVEEYVFEVSLDCSVGGFVAPLVAEDPTGLSSIFVFDGQLTDWYRAHVLLCPDVSSAWASDQFGLLPPNDAGLSQGDVLTAISLLRAVFDRHDGLPDAISDEQKAVVEARLGAMGAAAATSQSLDPTLPLDNPSCAP